MTVPPHMDPNDADLAARAERRLRRFRVDADRQNMSAAPDSPAEAMLWALAAIETLRAGLEPEPSGDRVSEFYAGGPAIPVRLVLGPDLSIEGKRAVVTMTTTHVYGVNGAMVVTRAPDSTADVVYLDPHHPDQSGQDVQGFSVSQHAITNAVGVLVRMANDRSGPPSEDDGRQIQQAIDDLRLILNLNENGEPR